MPKNVQTNVQIALILHASKITFKIPQARFQQYMNWKLADVQTGFRKGRGTEDQIANINWITEKAREFQKTCTSASLTMLKPLILWITTNWKILRDGNTRPPYLSNLYVGQEATVRIGRGTTDWLQIRKGVRQGCILSPCLFNLYAEHIMAERKKN